MSEHESVWLATAECPSFASLGDDVKVDVAVVGGGITGLTTALLLQQDGARVAVLEAGRVGAGTTGYSTGKVTSQHSLTYARLIERHGEQKARAYAEANQQALAAVAALAEATSAECQLERAPAYVYTRDADQRGRIEAEHAAAVRLGLPAHLTTDVDLPFSVAAALRFDDQVHLHPVRYTAALSRTLAARGALIFEHTRATKLDEHRDHVMVRSAGGAVRADQVVLATLLPFVDRGGFFAKTRASRSYGVAARLRTDAPAGMHISIDTPTRSTRPWVEGGRQGLLVVGSGHPTGQGDEGPARWGDLERWTRDHFDVESFDYRWSSQDHMSADGLPYVGRSPRMARTFVATGFNKWGLTNGTVAAHILKDLVAGRENPRLHAFDATRIGGPGTIAQLIKQNVHVATQLVKDWAGRLSTRSVTDLSPGDGGIVKAHRRTVAAYRDPDGSVKAVSPTCTHMGCTLRWNGAETSWDCPCHGSRFSTDGAVLAGPATTPLARIEVDVEVGGSQG